MPETSEPETTVSESAIQSSQPVKVLVYDSGVGGLSISGEIIAAFAREKRALELHYLSDNAFFPYGEKTPEQLIARAEALMHHCAHTIRPDIAVVACNTASTVVLPSLRSQFTFPIVGVVPAIKTAAKRSQTGSIALLATPGTVNRIYTQALIDEHAADKQIFRVGSAELVVAIERYLHGAALDPALLESLVAQCEQQCAEAGGAEIDTVVLGCTHFPLITKQLQALRPQWQWIDSGRAIAQRVLSLLSDGAETRQADAQHGQKQAHAFWLTAANANQSTLDQFTAGMGFGESRLLPE